MKRLAAVLIAAFVCGCATVPAGTASGNGRGGSTLVCHKGKKTLNLPQDAVQAHLDHGDRPGACQ